MTKKTTLTLPERLDIAGAEALQAKMQKVLQKDVELVELKAEKVERIDSAGIQLLLSFKAAVIDSGKEIHIIQASEEFIQAIDLLGSSELLQVQ